MKRICLMFLVLILCLSLAACGNTQNKYNKLIDHLERGDYDSAHSEIDRLAALDDESEPSNVLAIEVTTENWQQYFKIEERTNTSINNFGEIEDAYKSFYLVLKDEYTMASNEDQSTSVAVEYNYIKEWHYVTVDTTAGTVTIGDLNPDHSTEDMSGSMVTIRSKETPLTSGRSYTSDAQAVPMNFEIVRMKGTLYVEE